MLKMKLAESPLMFGITFIHNIPYVDLVTKLPVPGDTICNLVELDMHGKVLAEHTGYAYCHLSDQYNKSRGRKIAFARALEQGRFSRYERKQLWEQYFQRVKR